MDLLEFLTNPRAGEFDAFREHYPVCPECASEVRVWTELHQQLATSEPHPAPDILLRFEDDPAGLAPERRSAVERHVTSCALCRDELRALRAFDASPVQAPALAPAGHRFADAVTWLRRLLWHPALAYALVLILLTPILIETWGELRAPRVYLAEAPSDGKLAQLEESAKPSAPEPESAAEEALARSVPIGDKRAPEPGLASSLEKKNQPASAPARRQKRETQEPLKTDRAKDLPEPVAQPKAGVAEPAEADALRALHESEEESRLDADRQGALGGARAYGREDAEQETPRTLSPKRSRESFERRLGTADFAALELSAPVEQVLPVTRENEFLVLLIPTPTLAEGQNELDVHVVHANGRRRLRELVPATPGQLVTPLRIPAALFESGTHAAIVRVPGDPSDALRQFDYTFRVDP